MMTISYNWLSEYLPETVDPEKLSRILTSIGLEVESLKRYENIKGALEGLVVGEVLSCRPHPNADKLKITRVDTGGSRPLQIVCGANNVAAGQKVVVATVGTTIYPVAGEPMTMKLAKIRGEESQGMICAEDEIGLGHDHAGIIVLPADVPAGSPAADYFQLYTDWIYEIGLTPNRMDAMSHLGVAQDVCAYLTHHEKETVAVTPFGQPFQADDQQLPVHITIENKEACRRYAGVSISGVTVQESPSWLKNRLQSIGQRPINNIVDITNFILHETGQPLHAFDADAITGREIIVKNLPEGSSFITLDEKERKLGSEDLMICNAEEPMCIAGVFGGLKSGVGENTENIFLESAWFQPAAIRKTSVRHGLRTDAATHFEKGVDISTTVQVLKRAALLIRSVAGGNISSDITDIYPDPKPRTTITLSRQYLKKLSGKVYSGETVRKIFTSLGFGIEKENEEELQVTVPYSKPDISIPADLVEEILRIDGLDNIDIPATITISPSVDRMGLKESLKEKISGYLVAQGFVEICTNSITNSRYFSEEVLSTAVKMINNLSSELDVLRPSMLETGLEAIAYNIHRKNNNLRLFEFGKTYTTSAIGAYKEEEHLCLYMTGMYREDNWKSKGSHYDLYHAKGLAMSLLSLNGLKDIHFVAKEGASFLEIGHAGKKVMGTLTDVPKKTLAAFDIKQPVYVIDVEVASLLKLAGKQKITYREVNRFPVMQRDLAIVINREVTYHDIENTVQQIKLSKLSDMRLFDIFESEKLGAGKKSMAISFTFGDNQKTLTDKEVDGMMMKLIQGFEKDLHAEIRK